MSSLLPVQSARERILKHAPTIGVQEVPLEQGDGRTLARDLAAKITQPPFDASSMDGYAVRAQDLTTLPRQLRVIGQVAAGHPFDGQLETGQAVRIFTGAPLPAGADSIVIQEDADPVTGTDGNGVIIREFKGHGCFVRPRGVDFHSGGPLLAAGTLLKPRSLLLAAAMGHDSVTVRRRPRIGILATGDELVPPGKLPGAGQIISSIPTALAAMFSRTGAEPELLGIAPDQPDAIAGSLSAAEHCDLLVTIGGASVGEHDHVHKVLTGLGASLEFWRIAMRPGKPLMFARLGGQLAIGLPGNPVSAMICARVFVVPLITRMLGLNDSEASYTVTTNIALDTPLPANGPREHYMRATRFTADGTDRVRPAQSQDSSLMHLFSQSNCLIVRGPHAPGLEAGALVPVLDLDF